MGGAEKYDEISQELASGREGKTSWVKTLNLWGKHSRFPNIQLKLTSYLYFKNYTVKF